jgi:lipopolysaccharide export LptBFGC system permease protein LptF
MIASVIGHAEWWETVTLGRGSFRRGLRRVTQSVNEEKAKQQQFQWTATPPLMMAMVSVVHCIRSQRIAARLMMVMVMIVMVTVVMVVVVVVVMVLVLVVVVLFVSQVYIET